jgi:putative tryptophan/tyrosine transport system substrate-binding protein
MTLFGGAAVWPLTARAQQTGKLPTIGFLGASTADALTGRWLPAFVQHLRELGWVEGRTVAIDYRFAEGGQTQRYFEIATEFARLARANSNG